MAVRTKFSETGEFQPEWKPPVRLLCGLMYGKNESLSAIRQSKPLHRLLLPSQILFLQQNRPGVLSVNDPKGNQQGQYPRQSLHLQPLHLPLRKHRSLTSLHGHSGDVRDFEVTGVKMELSELLHFCSKPPPKTWLCCQFSINCPSTYPQRTSPTRWSFWYIFPSHLFFSRNFHLTSKQSNTGPSTPPPK